MNILVIGGSGGIGSALLQMFREHWPDATLSATYHQHPPVDTIPEVQWFTLDVTNEQAIAQLSAHFTILDILVNAVGFLHSEQASPERSLQQFQTSFFEKNIALNTLPSILIAKYFEKPLKTNPNISYFVALSARIGSIEDNQKGGWISYRVAKAALNMAMKTISIEWKTKVPRCCVLLFHPGTTDTALSQLFQKNLPAGQLHSAATTARALLQAIQQNTPADTGSFLSFDGHIIPW